MSSENKVEEQEAEIARLKGWIESVSAAIATIPEFTTGHWGGDKAGWGWHFEMVRYCQRQRETAEASLAQLKQEVANYERSFEIEADLHIEQRELAECLEASLASAREEIAQWQAAAKSWEEQSGDYRSGFNAGWDMAHESLLCGHARANLRDPKYGTTAYQGEERCEMCALRAEFTRLYSPGGAAETPQEQKKENDLSRMDTMGSSADSRTASEGAPNPKRELLASLAHEQWTGWMRYLFSQCAPDPIRGGCWDGGIIIPYEWVTRWRRQMGLLYCDLREDERNSDRHEADRVLNVLAVFNSSPALAPAPDAPYGRRQITNYRANTCDGCGQIVRRITTGLLSGLRGDPVAPRTSGDDTRDTSLKPLLELLAWYVATYGTKDLTPAQLAILYPQQAASIRARFPEAFPAV